MKLMKRKELQNREQLLLEENIMRALPSIQEANFVSEQMKRGVAASIRIHTEKAVGSGGIMLAADKTTVQIQVGHHLFNLF